MKTEWPAEVLDGINRIQTCINSLDYEASRLKYAEVMDPINDELQRLFLNIRLMKGTIEKWRAGAPCKIWVHDGLLHCAVHKAHWSEKDDDGVSDCPKRIANPT